jgi:hypothetical protein
VIDNPERLLETIEQAQIHDHLCLLYRNQTEELTAAVAFMAAGLEARDMCVYVANDNSVSQVAKAMERAGIDVTAAVKRKQLVLATKKESYLRNGRFEPDEAINFFADTADKAQAEGWRALRGNAEMTWQLGGDPGTGRLTEYEAKMNRKLFPAHEVMGLCQYNMKRFSPATIRDVLYTHPRVIIGNLVCKNFYYKPPEEFLARNDESWADDDAIAELEVPRMLDNIYQFERSEVALRQSQRDLEQANGRLEDRVRERTADLEQKARELQDLNRNMAGREYRIRELEREVALLRTRLTRGPK